jgi:hypothetical protein
MDIVITEMGLSIDVVLLIAASIFVMLIIQVKIK